MTGCVLVVVCWNMAERDDFLLLLRDWRGGSVLVATFGLTLDRGRFGRYHRRLRAGGVRGLRPGQAAATSAFPRNARL